MIAGLGVLAIVGLMYGGRASSGAALDPTSASSRKKAGVLTTSERLWDIGTISMKDGLVEHRFSITNPGQAPVFVSSVYTSCMCTSAYLQGTSGEKGPFGMRGMGYLPPANESIAPGETREVRVVYDPNAHGPSGVGSIDRFVYVTEKDGGMLALEIKALVTP